ncbi:hypothetical protein BKI52_39010 [marine bacterium AO1-C]|nr:hypothetical protein BKI52_39010 [marine bacterium AO1-C]
MTNQEKDKLIQELQAKLVKYETKRFKAKAKKKRLFKLLGLFLYKSSFKTFFGARVYTDFQNFWDKWSIWIKTERSRKTLPENATRDFIASLVARVVRIGLIGFSIALIPVVMVVWQSFMINKQNRLLAIQTRQVEAQTQLAEANRRSSLVFLMSNIMDKVDQEIRNDKQYQDTLKNPLVLTAKRITEHKLEFIFRDDGISLDSLRDAIPKKKLSSQLEGRIISLCNSLKPYRYLEEGSLVQQSLSPERGQLLVSLIESNIDTKSIFKKTTFEGADLEKSTFEYADLNLLNLKKSNLMAANLFRAYLIKANLEGANLNYANMKLSALLGVNLKEGSLNYTDLSSANLDYADLSEANLIKANLNGAYLMGTNLSGANLKGAYLGKAFLLGNVYEGSLDKPISKVFSKGSSGTIAPILYKALLNDETNFDGAYVTDPRFFQKINKYILNDTERPFDLNRYKITKLKDEDVEILMSKHWIRKNWRVGRKNVPIYQIRLK